MFKGTSIRDPVTILIGFGLLFVASTEGAPTEFDFQNFLENSDIAAVIPRSNASEGSSVLLTAGHYTEISFCLPVAANVTVENVVYSNDGDEDSVPVFIDQELVGSFETRADSNWGHNWNRFLSSGAIGQPRLIAPGVHKLQVSVNQTDDYGVELDTVLLNIDIPGFDNEEDTQYIKCEKCLDRVVPGDDPLDETAAEESGPVLVLQNQGLVTSADGQTVAAIDMFPRPVVPCRVLTASPWYIGGGANQNTPQNIWQIGNQDSLSEEFSVPYFSGAPTFAFAVGSPDSDFPRGFDTSVVDNFQVSFDGSQFPNLFANQNTMGYVEMGLVLGEDQFVNVSLETTQDAGNSLPVSRTFFDVLNTNTWEVPLERLDASGQNTLTFRLDSVGAPMVDIDFIRMYVQQRTSEAAAALTPQQFSIEARSTGTDPSRPTMTVNGINPTPVQGADSILIKVNANGGLDSVPIFELMRDGVITMTSPLLGEFLPVDRRSAFRLAPSADGIKTVDVNPQDLLMNVTFLDDSVVRLRVDATPETAEFTITGASLNLDTEASPLVRFEAPWTSDANNGVDTMVTNGRNVNQISNGWENLTASTVDFINRCGSGEEATGSDWKIELLDSA